MNTFLVTTVLMTQMTKKSSEKTIKIKSHYPVVKVRV